MFFGSPTSSPTLPKDSYPPLEASSDVIRSEEEQGRGRFRGGMGSVQIVRYRDTPVGPYDELVFIPGFFDTPGGKYGKQKKNNRITRIYVSQKDTTWNGRENWNIPKHLARFEFSHPTTIPGSASSSTPKTLTVKIYPPSQASTIPFFSATLQPFSWVPSVPFSSRILTSVLGWDLRLVQPPLPEGKGVDGFVGVDGEGNGDGNELCGTKEWKVTNPSVWGKRGKGMWILDVKMGLIANGGEAPDESDGGGGEDGWFPSVKPLKVGLWVEEATLEFGVPEVLDPEVGFNYHKL